MVESAARLADHVLPRLPVRRWVLLVPKRLRYDLQQAPTIETLPLANFLSVVEQGLRRGCQPAGPGGSRSLMLTPFEGFEHLAALIPPACQTVRRRQPQPSQSPGPLRRAGRPSQRAYGDGRSGWEPARQAQRRGVTGTAVAFQRQRVERRGILRA
jgi:hypothetical protein